MEFPITITAIEWSPEYDKGPIKPDRIFGGDAGAWVSIKPVSEEKTYLGVLLGDYCAPSLAIRKETGALIVRRATFGNPAIWVPDLKRVVMGYESWWGEIKSPDDLRQITDADIQNVWYVRALKELSEKTETA